MIGITLHKANKFFFLANSIDIKDDNKKKAVLLSPCGSDTYKLFRSLVALENIARSSYVEIKRLMGKHRKPKTKSYSRAI